MKTYDVTENSLIMTCSVSRYESTSYVYRLKPARPDNLLHEVRTVFASNGRRYTLGMLPTSKGHSMGVAFPA